VISYRARLRRACWRCVGTSTSSAAVDAGDLFAANADFHDTGPHIAGHPEVAEPLDDLSPDPEDWAIAIAAEGDESASRRRGTDQPPFDYAP